MCVFFGDKHYVRLIIQHANLLSTSEAHDTRYPPLAFAVRGRRVFRMSQGLVFWRRGEVSRHRDSFDAGPASSPVHMRYANSTCRWKCIAHRPDQLTVARRWLISEYSKKQSIPARVTGTRPTTRMQGGDFCRGTETVLKLVRPGRLVHRRYANSTRQRSISRTGQTSSSYVARSELSSG